MLHTVTVLGSSATVLGSSATCVCGHGESEPFTSFLCRGRRSRGERGGYRVGAADVAGLREVGRRACSLRGGADCIRRRLACTLRRLACVLRRVPGANPILRAAGPDYARPDHTRLDELNQPRLV
jgi:hypothetical protein